MSDVAVFPDVEDALCELLEHIAPTFTVTDETLTGPCIVIARTGGGADRQGLFDTARVAIECFGESRQASKELNAAVREWMCSNSEGVDSTAGLLDSIDEDVSPTPVAYGLEYDNIRRQVSAWVISTRSL